MQVLTNAFLFNNTTKNLYSTLVQVIDFIESNVPACSEQLTTRCKLIMTELLTNGIKHCNGSETVIEILFNNANIQILKIDTCKPLFLEPFENRDAMQWPLSKITSDKVVVYCDEMCCLYAHIENVNTASFTTEDLRVEIPPRPTDILEHFGLMIITKASDCFLYRYNSEKKSNTFEVTIKL